MAMSADIRYNAAIRYATPPPTLRYAADTLADTPDADICWLLRHSRHCNICRAAVLRLRFAIRYATLAEAS